MKSILASILITAAGMFSFMRPSLSPDQTEILSYMSIVRVPDGTGSSVPVLRISGINVQVVNGAGSTDSSNKLGNLIIGYNELNGIQDAKLGSHNLILGTGNTYLESVHGSIISGDNNFVSSPNSMTVATQGAHNDGPFASIISCENGTVFTPGDFAAILGGESNAAIASNSTITGGLGNFINTNAPWGTVSGGWIRNVFTPRDWAAGSLYEDD